MKRRTGRIALGAAAVFIATAILAKEAGLGFNTTESAPFGLWIVGGGGHVGRGNLVSICPPDVPMVKALAKVRPLYRGDCEGSGMVPLLKPIAALPGDTVTLRSGSNALVNGREIPNTTANNLAWPGGTYTVKPGQVWVFSTYSKDSFDSRYFGPVNISSIRGEAHPVLVDGNIEDMRRGIGHD